MRFQAALTHLNGKVERLQRTDLDEFYVTVDLKDPALADRWREWQHYYNWDRLDFPPFSVALGFRVRG